MNIKVDGKTHQLNAADLLGTGGEGNVFKFGGVSAIKIYHQPTLQRGNKLGDMVRNPPKVDGSRVIRPLALVYSEQGGAVGFVMDRIGVGYEDLSRLSVRKYRVPARQTAQLFLDGARTVQDIHNSGYVIGDFNDFNEKYEGQAMLFLDVDAYQFGKYPCPVGTEQFLSPDLYGIDLSLRPYFKPDHDWYSYSVLLFKSLLGVHPYGGTHRGIKQLTERALKKVMVLDRDVVYPTIALPSEILSDDLRQEFWDRFAKGKQGPFSTALLDDYVGDLLDCKSCGATYPASRRNCPVCSAVSVKPVATFAFDVNVKPILGTAGQIIFSKVIGGTLYVVARESRGDVLYTFDGAVKETQLPNGQRYDMTSDLLLRDSIGYAAFNLLPIGNIGNGRVLDTANFVGTHQASFRANGRFVFRIVAGQLMAGEMRSGQFVEHAIRPVMNDQTWFVVRQDSQDKPTVCGFFQVFREQRWWLIFEGQLFDNLPLTDLAVGETQTDVLVRMDNSSALIMRQTQQAGVDYLHIAVVDSRGRVTNKPRIKATEPLPHGAAYAHGVLLSATDDGLKQEKDGSVKMFPQTKGVIEGGDTLYAYGNGLLVVKEQTVTLVSLA